MKLKCQERHNQLLASQAYQEFNRDADEVSICLSFVWRLVVLIQKNRLVVIR